MHKMQLLKERDEAQQQGDLAAVQTITEKLEEIEQRANELDKKRTANITAIRFCP